MRPFGSSMFELAYRYGSTTLFTGCSWKQNYQASRATSRTVGQAADLPDPHP
jgi:hypothetical protein